MSFADRDCVFWMDGELVPRHEATIHILIHSLPCDAGIFEGARSDRSHGIAG